MDCPLRICILKGRVTVAFLPSVLGVSIKEMSVKPISLPFLQLRAEDAPFSNRTNNLETKQDTRGS